jgi:N utilization substance protein B
VGRRIAREIAMKVLYRYEEGDTDLAGIIADVLKTKKYAENDQVYCKTLVKKTLGSMDQIDEQIVRVLKNWPYERISVIDKTILRMGVCEILFFDEVPPQVSINEAIEIGKKYGGKDSGRFINGILDAIKKNHESRSNK